MAYEKLNLAKGDIWKAEHVAHMEEGIAQNDEKLVELSEEKLDKGSPVAHQQLVTDASGAVTWEDRTHYKRDRITVKLSPEFDKPTSGSAGERWVGGDESNDPLQVSAALAVGHEMGPATWEGAYDDDGWVFYWDGVRYESPRRRLPLVWNAGSPYPFGATVFQHGDDVRIAITYCDDTPHTFEWELAEPELKPLSEEFLPTTVPVIQTATVGQTIAVKAVDENGKPTEWEAVDNVTEERVNELIDAKIAAIPNAEEANF